jgi:hypothetical protein
VEVSVANKTDGKAPPVPLKIPIDEAESGKLRTIGGSRSDRFNNAVINSAVNTSWFPLGQSIEDSTQQIFVTVTALRAFAPVDEIEGLLAAQAMAAHHASMECSRLSMIAAQPFECVQVFRKAAANASRTFIELLSALDRKRGKGGQQLVRVEHVHVHSGGKAIVGTVEHGGRGEGMRRKCGKDPVSRLPDWHTTLPLAQSCPRCGARTRSGNLCRQPAIRKANRCRLHGGGSTGPKTAEGLKRISAARTIHGRYRAEMIAMRRAMATLKREARRTIATVR